MLMASDEGALDRMGGADTAACAAARAKQLFAQKGDVQGWKLAAVGLRIAIKPGCFVRFSKYSAVGNAALAGATST
jgi:hypothetical protein